MLFTTTTTPDERVSADSSKKRTRAPSTELDHRCQSCGARLTEDPEKQLAHVRTAHPNMIVRIARRTA